MPFQECHRDPSHSCDTHRLVTRRWCHTASPCRYLQEKSGDCSSEFVLWETDLLHGTTRDDISRQQELWTCILWWTVDWCLLTFGHVEPRCFQPSGCPLHREGGTARKKLTKYKAHKVFWSVRGLCKGIHDTCGGRAGGSQWRPWAASSLTGLLLSKKIFSDELYEAQMDLL